jgi:hypothetical protein
MDAMNIKIKEMLQPYDELSKQFQVFVPGSERDAAMA